MSVHALITLVLASFSADTLLHLLALTAYNRTGLPAPVATLSLFTTPLTHTLARGLLLTLAMGAGVTRASLGPATCRVLLACLLDLFVTLWDAFASAFAPARSAAIHTIPAGIANAALYGWAFAALFHTLRELEEKKQTSKLQLFLRLRMCFAGAFSWPQRTLLLSASPRCGARRGCGESSGSAKTAFGLCSSF